MEGNTILAAEGICKRFREKEVLTDASFSLCRGEILSIIGESGCGKSTLLRIIAAYLPPDSGTVIYKDQDLLSLSGKRLRRTRSEIQLIFQSPSQSLDPRMKVKDIIKEAIEDETDPACYLDAVKLGPKVLDKRPAELSGGEMQRVALARAIAARPSIILADEPVSSLDASLKASMLNLFLCIRDSLGITLMIVEHDEKAAAGISDRIARMEKGRISLS